MSPAIMLLSRLSPLVLALDKLLDVTMLLLIYVTIVTAITSVD